MLDKGAEKRRHMLDSAAMVAGGLGKGVEIRDCGVCQRIRFQVTPEVLGGIEFRRIGWEKEGMEIWNLSEEFLNLSGAMGFESVPKEHDNALDLNSQLAKEINDLRGGNIQIGMETEV